MNKEREAFNRWVLTHPNNLTITAYEENIMFDAWQAAKTIPEGFVLVPKEPTSEMLYRGYAAPDNLSAKYKAMIEAQEPADDN